MSLKRTTSLHRIALAALLFCGFSLSMMGVTKEEMEKARAISAKIYLRWANNGSDYLDKQNPSNVSDLQLREKEKTNIKAFLSIPLPSDYSSWDKKKLVEYWSSTALSTSGLNADGVRSGAKKAIRSALNAMSVAEPAPEAEAPAKEPEAVDTPKVAEDLPQEVEQLTEVVTEEIDTIDSAAVNDSLQIPAKKESSSTWIYVVALALLVIAVIVLVVYASKNMNKGNSTDEPHERGTRHKAEPNVSEPANRKEEVYKPSARNTSTIPTDSYVVTATEPEGDTSSRMREKFAETLAAKQEEIRMLSRRVESLAAENKSLAEENERLQLEADRLRKEKDDLLVAGHPATPAPGTTASTPFSSKASTTPEPGRPRVIYLGRVNTNGIFVRADRSLNPGNSIYTLETTDGFTGTFRVADHSSVYDLVFPRPQEMLSGGCVAMDITDTKGRSRIETESPGTAIFEDNCWRVVRKARIRYI
ncbi:MAG: hypothetical protein NC097_04725 [Clostridium sp.]|nr:hypothetical protein [Prevotella sp.]MCM1429081.1 hypothetical protein [Clostridium sp.]